MGFKSIMKHIWSGTKQVAPIALSAFPGGAVANKVLAAVIFAEENTEGKRGVEKFQVAANAFRLFALPALLRELERQLGREIPEDAADRFARAQIQATVDLLNEIGALPKSPK
jgi:hypothetical protein